MVPEGDRGGSSYYVETGAGRILIDCGPGAVQSLARHDLPWDSLTDLVLTHFHADHIGALPGLFFGLRHGIPPPGRSEPFDVWGPVGTRGLFDRIAAAYGDFMLDPGFETRVSEIKPGDEVGIGGGTVRLRCHDTPHTEESLALRFDAMTASVGYTGDTGPSDALGGFFRGVDLLISECSLYDDQVGDNHLSPGRVARLASAASPGLLLLTHVYPHLRGDDVPALIRAAGYEGGEIRLAHDGLELDIG